MLRVMRLSWGDDVTTFANTSSSSSDEISLGFGTYSGSCTFSLGESDDEGKGQFKGEMGSFDVGEYNIISSNGFDKFTNTGELSQDREDCVCDGDVVSSN